MSVAVADSRLQRAVEWFSALGREPFAFQLEAWEAYLGGRDGLILAPTGTGKTLAAALGPMIEAMGGGRRVGIKGDPFSLLWITPLRALANDTVDSLKTAVKGMGLNWSVELRTSDTSSSVRRRQKEKLPSVLVTTPESLSVLLSYSDASERLGSVRAVVVDEWHELMGTKRGVQAELGLARLRTISPSLRTWGLSATVGNVEEAARTLLGVRADPVIVHAPDTKQISVQSELPETVERFPWAGHLGTRMTQRVILRIEQARSTLIFTNTRSQSELWFKALLEAKPDWLGQIALHHGSLDRKLRAGVEQMLREGKLLAVVCTSSLDLGVDFWPVDQVIQIGSPKGVSRAMQRAGRSGHQPGALSQITCVPTQAFELVEFSALRHGVEQRAIEERRPVELALDVLAQHVVTLAGGGGFDAQQLYQELTSTHAFARLTPEQWQWVMDFAERGGPSLVAYPRFARIKQEGGRWVAVTEYGAKMHRLGIGTIASDSALLVKTVSNKYLGNIEESFISKLRPGDTFIFAGRSLQFVRLHDMTALVRPGKGKSGAVPRWMGGRLPMSSCLAEAVRYRLDQAARGEFVDSEMEKVRPILELQSRWSAIPRIGELVIEAVKTRDGYHHFLYPFLGRLAHEGLAALLTYRLGLRGISPITATFNDYGLELLCPSEMVLRDEDWQALLTAEKLQEEVLHCLNGSELARRHFREIARVAGLLVPARPGAPRSVRQLQASSELFFDVFNEFDPQNLLLDQARREVLDRQLEFARLKGALEHLARQSIVQVSPNKISPLAFPLWAERIASQQLRSEKASDRIERLARQLEAAAGLPETGFA